MNTVRVLAVALAVAFVVAVIASLAILVLLRWRRREAVASTHGFVLFDLCCQDPKRCCVKPSVDKKRRWPPREHYSDQTTEEGEDCELARWKKQLYGGQSRALYTIDEETERGTTPLTTPAASPLRADVRALETDMATESAHL